MIKPMAAAGVIVLLNFDFIIDPLDGQIEPSRDSFNVEIATTATTSLSSTATPIYFQNNVLGDLNEIVAPEGTKIDLFFTNTRST